MPIANKILGKVAPIAVTDTLLYTVPTNTQANVNMFIANRSATDTTVRVAVTKFGNSLSNIDYIFYDVGVNINSPINITGLALAAGDMITVYNELATCSFVATGIEIT